MMALGVTQGCDPAPEGVVLVPQDGLAIVASDSSDARDRAIRQIRAATRLSSFVPFSARRACPIPAASDWLARHRPAVVEALHRLCGTCQMVLDLRQSPPARGTPGDWLRHRAERYSLPERLRATLSAGSIAARARPTPTGAAVDFLIDAAQRQEFSDSVSMACRATAPGGWSGLLVGPWPPLAFHGLDDLP